MITNLPIELLLQVTQYLEPHVHDFRNFLACSTKIQKLLQPHYAIVTNDINYAKIYAPIIESSAKSHFFISNMLTSDDWQYTPRGRDVAIDPYESFVVNSDFWSSFQGTVFIDFKSDDSIDMLSDSIRKVIDFVRDVHFDKKGKGGVVRFRYTWIEDGNSVMNEVVSRDSDAEFANKVLINATHSSLDQYFNMLVEECGLVLKITENFKPPEYMKNASISNSFFNIFNSKSRRRYS